MLFNGFIIFIALANLSSKANAVKVNMQGSLSFSKDVINMIKHYIKQSNFDGRRSNIYSSNKENSIYLTVTTAALCRNLDLCQNEFKELIVRYVTKLVKAVYTVLDGLLYVKFEQKLKHNLKEIRNILRSANDKVTDDNETYIWTDVIKKICGNIQETAILLVTERLRGDPKDIRDVKKKLTQELVVETIIVEEEFRTILCSEHNICSKSCECTKALNSLMSAFKDLDNDNVKTFVRVFSEVLSGTTFYSKLSELTANEFQIILNDMAFSDNVPTKDVLLTIQNTIEDRLNSSANNYRTIKGRDVELVHVILSDMDHIYSKNKAEPFYRYLSGFYDWTKSGGRLSSILRQIMNDISSQISLQSDDLIVKLINEVRVFLEITIDPEK